MTLSFCGGGCSGGGWGGVQSHVRVQPDCSVEVVLCYVVVGVVTIVLHSGSKWDAHFVLFFVKKRGWFGSLGCEKKKLYTNIHSFFISVPQTVSFVIRRRIIPYMSIIYDLQ